MKMGEARNERKDLLPLIAGQKQASKSLTEQSADHLLIDQKARTAASVKRTAEGSGHLLDGKSDRKSTRNVGAEQLESQTKPKARAEPPAPKGAAARNAPKDKEPVMGRLQQGGKPGPSDRQSNPDSRLAQMRSDDVTELSQSGQKIHQTHQQRWVTRLVTDSQQKQAAEAESAKSLLTVGPACYSKPIDTAPGSGMLGAVGAALSTGTTVLHSSADRGEESSNAGELGETAAAFAGKPLKDRLRSARGRSGKRGVSRAESRAGGRLARQAQDSVVRPVQKDAAAQAAAAAAKLRTAAVNAVRELIAFLSATVTSTLGPLLIGGVILVTIIVVLLSVMTSTMETPYGLFFVTESEQELEMSDAITRLTNSYYSKFYDILMEQDYDELHCTCSITDSDEAWKTILSLYAVEVCKEGKSPAVMDEEHYDILEKVFWEYIHIRFHTSVSYDEYTENDAGEDEGTTTETVFDEFGNEIEVEVPAAPITTIVEFKTLEITITTSSVDEVAQRLDFTEEELASVQELLDEEDGTWSSLSDLFTNLIISVDGAVGTFDVTAYADVAETVFRGCVEAGYSVEAACGILGNIQQECSMNPLCSSGGSFGLCQWLGGRLDALKRLRDYTSAATQTGFLLYELEKYPSWWSTYGGEVHHTYNGKKITSLSSFKDCNDPQAAAGAFCIVFERPGEFPGNHWYEQRLKYAQSWYEYAQSHWLNPSGAAGTAGDILEACQKLANIVYDDNNWHYHTTHYGTFQAARSGSRKMDCAKYVSYVLQDIGILSPGQTFYSSGGGSIRCKGKGTLKALKRRCEIIPVGKKVKDCASILQPGDICCMTRHTCIFSDSKGGDLYWWSAGTGACKKGKFKWLYKHYPSYQSRGGKKGQTIHYIIRAKG